jgi:hypothetical protein
MLKLEIMARIRQELVKKMARILKAEVRKLAREKQRRATQAPWQTVRVEKNREMLSAQTEALLLAVQASVVAMARNKPYRVA